MLVLSHCHGSNIQTQKVIHLNSSNNPQDNVCVCVCVCVCMYVYISVETTVVGFEASSHGIRLAGRWK